MNSPLNFSVPDNCRKLGRPSIPEFIRAVRTDMATALSRTLGRHLASFLSKQLPGYQRYDIISAQGIADVMQPGDILLVEGNSRISIAIKYLTMSSWSHACLHVGPANAPLDAPVLLEADLQNGVVLVPLTKYAAFNIRICRPVGLTEAERESVISFARARLGHQYDLKNIFDLMRYLIQKPPVPNYLRRSMIGYGSGEPTKAICSTLIAQSFQNIDYPILPRRGPEGDDGEVPLYYKRHFTHYVPRDFDVSPYFRVVKPTLEKGFDFHEMNWHESRQ